MILDQSGMLGYLEVGRTDKLLPGDLLNLITRHDIGHN